MHRPSPPGWWLGVIVLAVGGAACQRRAPAPAPAGPDAASDDARPGAAASVDDDDPGEPDAGAEPLVPRPPPGPDQDGLPAVFGLPPDKRAIQVVDGQERTVDAEEAVRRGWTLVDLSDDWAPAIFDDGKDAAGLILPNRYRTVFVGMANDRVDGDGMPLGAGEHNFLEVFGVPPSLSVLRERFVADAARTCDRDVDRARLLAVERVETWGASSEKKALSDHHFLGLRLEERRQKQGVATLEELGEMDRRYAKEVKAFRRFELERLAFSEVEKRVACEGLLDPKVKHKAGLYDAPMRKAVLDFQRKAFVFEATEIGKRTLLAMTQPLLLNDFLALRRALTERVVRAGAILEDGTAPHLRVRGQKGAQPPTYLGKDGERHAVPNLVAADRDATLQRLGLYTPEDAVAFFKRHAASDFRRLRAAVRFVPPPEYYGPHMELVAEVDRGDIWYDFPFNEQGERGRQSIQKFPSHTLFVKWNGERVPLVRWKTTIGGWRSELAADGEEYYRYKESDVGPRVWRHIVAGPVWIPPTSSPLGSMVKEKKVNGYFAKITNYDETGPGYLSAYGLVAGIHEKESRRNGTVHYHDNGIRSHGSSDYMSLQGSHFSHGCHRLYNNLAVRLFSFVLQHRRHKVEGQMALGFRRSFWWKGEVYEMRLPTRGFYYELDPAVPVETLEGTIKGRDKVPPVDYVRKPGMVYRSDKPPPTINGLDSKGGV